MDRKLKFLPVLFLATSALLAAQARLGSISGTVRDSAGVPQLGAAVEVLASAANTAAALVYTDSRGRYSVPRLPAGHYQVKATQTSFLPTLRENVALRSGAAVVVNLTLNTVFEALQILPMRGRTPQDTDDWKWTLRSTANRPILRVLDNSPLVVVFGSEDKDDRVIKARVAFLAGPENEGFGSAADQSTSFKVEKSIFSSGTLSVGGNVGENASEPAVLRAAYSHQVADGERPELAVTLRRFQAESSATERSALQALALSLSDEVRLSSFAELQYGTEYQTIQFLGRRAAFYPFGTLDVHLSPDMVLEYAYSSSLPNMTAEKGFDSAPADLSESGPRVSLIGSNPHLERAAHQEISISRRVGNNSFQLAGYMDRVQNAALLGVGDNAADDGSGAILGDPYSNTFTYNGGSLHTNGVRVVAQHKFSPLVTSTLDVAYGGAIAVNGPERFVVAADPALNFETVRQAAVAAKLSGRIPHSKTSWIASYRWNNGNRAVTPVDAFNVSPGQADPFLNLFIRQPLPSPAFLPGQMEALVDVRNLLAQGYVPVMGQDGHTMYLVQSARSVRGGVAFSF